MQFTGHSLSVHQSGTVPSDFNPVPYCQPSSPTPMEYALPTSLEWHVWRGRRSIYNNLNAIYVKRFLKGNSFYADVKQVIQYRGDLVVMNGENLLEKFSHDYDIAIHREGKQFKKFNFFHCI